MHAAHYDVQPDGSEEKAFSLTVCFLQLLLPHRHLAAIFAQI